MKALIFAATAVAAVVVAGTIRAQATNTQEPEQTIEQAVEQTLGQAAAPTAAEAAPAPTAAQPTAAAPVAANRIDRIRPDSPRLAALGSFAVGVRTMSFTNPGQPDIANATAEEVPVADREITVEVWYPAADDTPPGTSYTTFLRDGLTEITLTGSAARDALPFPGEAFPFVILSHGYPGNRFLLSHFGENLASKGYVVAAIDHPDSTYSDLGAFGATLVHRPHDQRFVLDAFAALDSDLGAITDTDRTGIIGYSMGGYGALVLGGAGVTQAATEFSFAPPQGLLRRNMAGSDSHAALVDDRLKAIVAIGPWGRNTDFWDEASLAALKKPLLIMAGSADDVSGYQAIRQIFAETTGTTRHLLTFENANHNAAAPIPAPAESWRAVETLDFVPFDHYADPVWDTVRMNNIAQHFTTAFLDIHLRGDRERETYLSLVPEASKGVISLDEEGQPTAEHTWWPGFPARSAVGLRFETLRKGE